MVDVSAPSHGAPAGSEPKRHRRDPERHRADILDAARASLTEHGYARATIRDIARRAGVTHGLVMRHFQSKEQLFLAAVAGARGLDDAIKGDPQGLPERIAALFIARMEHSVVDDPFVALIRCAASNEEAATRLYRAMNESSARLYRQVLRGDDLETRIGLVGAALLGITFSRYVVRSGVLAEMPPDVLTVYLAGLLRHILAPVLPVGEP